MQNIRWLRTQKSLTQAKLAQKCGLSQAYINELENGRKTNPSVEVLKRLADALDVPVSVLFYESEKGSKGVS